MCFALPKCANLSSESFFFFGHRASSASKSTNCPRELSIISTSPRAFAIVSSFNTSANGLASRRFPSASSASHEFSKMTTR